MIFNLNSERGLVILLNMKDFFILILLIIAIFLPFTSASADDKINQNAPEITAVEIFPSGAKFIFAVTPDKDKNFCVNITGAFNKDSIRLLNFYDAEDFKVLEKFRDNSLSDIDGLTPPVLLELKKARDEQSKLIADLNAKKSALEQTKTLLGTVTPKEADAQNLLNYIKDAQNIKLSAENELADIKIKLDEANAKLQRIKRELADKTPQNSDKFIEITGKLKNIKSTPEKILIEAFTDAARWYPRYTMELDSESGEIKTSMYARLSQRTGFDYNGTVIFHTKYPDENVSNPVINPLRVSLTPRAAAVAPMAKQNSVMKSRAVVNNFYAMADSAMEAEAEMDAGGNFLSEEYTAAPILPVMNATLADNSVQGAGNFTGDGNEAEFVLGEIKLSGKVSLVTIPEQRNSAWILVEMDDITTPLIPGKASLFVDGQPSGSTNIPEYGLSRAKIPFGYAPQITVKKEAIVEKTGTSWFSGGIFTSGYRLQITNSMSAEKLVTIRDRLPIPTDDKIKLEVKNITPEPKERDKENRLTWELPVKSGETVKIIVDYTLSYPSGETLQYR